ncbi:ATP-binding protein [Streptomyces sp. NPDC050856]|uniref:ATP-binding protein n=1 Tax=Streptomyces sp. NPDC050856 TaxID=3154939 RepID=UPI0033C66B51
MEPAVRLDEQGPVTSSGPRSRAGAAYEGGSDSIAAARHFAADFLTRVHGLPPTSRAVESVRLVVSELITNACKYAFGPCALELEVFGRTLEITVWDSAPVLPVAQGADPGRVGQHGMEIVLALCEDVDVRLEPVGKRVIARIALPEPEARPRV